MDFDIAFGSFRCIGCAGIIHANQSQNGLGPMPLLHHRRLGAVDGMARDIPGSMHPMRVAHKQCDAILVRLALPNRLNRSGWTNQGWSECEVFVRLALQL